MLRSRGCYAKYAGDEAALAVINETVEEHRIRREFPDAYGYEFYVARCACPEGPGGQQPALAPSVKSTDDPDAPDTLETPGSPDSPPLEPDSPVSPQDSPVSPPQPEHPPPLD